MHKVNGMIIVPVRRGGVRGHVTRTRSGVKVGMFIGHDSLQRALSFARARPRG